MTDAMKAIHEQAALKAVGELPMKLEKLENDLQTLMCATLAASIVSAMGRPVSIQEALNIQRDIYFANNAGKLAGHSSYQEWAKTKDKVLNEPRK